MPMDKHDPDSRRDIIPISGRKPSDPLAGGGNVDPRSGESALAREFAQRALTPFIANLRNRQGQLDAKKVAPALGLTVTQLAECLELHVDELTHSPPAPELEARLDPFAMVIGVVRDVYGGDDNRVRLWLRTPRPELNGRTPNETLCVPGGIQTVIQFVLGAWLGNAD
jgi:hypothetical protein